MEDSNSCVRCGKALEGPRIVCRECIKTSGNSSTKSIFIVICLMAVLLSTAVMMLNGM